MAKKKTQWITRATGTNAAGRLISVLVRSPSEREAKRWVTTFRRDGCTRIDAKKNVSVVMLARDRINNISVFPHTEYQLSLSQPKRSRK